MTIPIILCGGMGSRLWPVSRQSCPKQFIKFDGKHSLFQQTVLRCNGASFNSKPIIIGTYTNRYLISQDLEEIGVDADILLEPEARNTCPAVACACLFSMEKYPGAPVLIAAADHIIFDQKEFVQSVKDASQKANDGHLVTFGVKPTKPATGYGYIKPGRSLTGLFEVEAFVEKPDEATARQYVKQGYLWNSGNFVFKAEVFLEELEKSNGKLLSHAKLAVENRYEDLGFYHLEKESFIQCQSVSIDIAVMEHSSRLAVLPVSFSWSDVGDWQELAKLGHWDENDNSSFGHAHMHFSKHNIVHSQNSTTVLFGMHNTLVANMDDLVLVADKNNSQAIKQLVEHLASIGLKQATKGHTVFKPWGNYKQIDKGEGYRVKRIVVRPGGQLSLQSHKHRAEHWVVVSGTAEINIDGQNSKIEENQSVYVPCGSTHRLTNRKDVPLIIIEVQTGNYLGEDDITRYEDAYRRHSHQ